MKRQLYTNGTILTMDDAAPRAEAVLVEDGIIRAVGSLTELADLATGAETIDLEGHTLLPGFIDSHSHISMACLFPRFSPPPVGDIDSLEKLEQALHEELAAHPPKEGAWFIGMGYDNALFEGGAHPTAHDLDRVSSEIPLLLMHASSHVGVLNSRALELSGITRDTPDPDGGIICRDENGEPTGVLEESAITAVLARQAATSMTPEFLVQTLVQAQDLYASHGITTAQEGCTAEPLVKLLQGMGLAGKLKIDICAYPGLDGLKDLDAIPAYDETRYAHHFRVGGVKLLLDGSPQAKTAWLSQPYHIVPEGRDAGYRGYPSYSDEQALAFMHTAAEHRWQVLAHCNGDAASEQYLDAYEQAYGTGSDARCVMVHAQTVREDQLDRMEELGMLPTFFHDHTFYWGDYHLDSVLGPERGRRISPLASALRRGMTFTLHQDTPVVPPDMVFSLHNAVNRTTRAGRDIGPEFAVDVDTALKALTIWAAYQYHEEDTKGSIAPGKLADFAILDRDPHTVAQEQLKDLSVLATIKEGTFVYRARG